ncbi:hypothetical protein CRG98_011612 [Punica granatum]|uniref:Uncharacterized protein n=1 Tax=Punica granatum TaxID=22663 RepID=A0A2I0KJP8_PUNGR|nr:hypothetical protein CRG98_011612 [Punica granatum]
MGRLWGRRDSKPRHRETLSSNLERPELEKNSRLTHSRDWTLVLGDDFSLSDLDFPGAHTLSPSRFPKNGKPIAQIPSLGPSARRPAAQSSSGSPVQQRPDPVQQRQPVSVRPSLAASKSPAVHSA